MPDLSPADKSESTGASESLILSELIRVPSSKGHEPLRYAGASLCAAMSHL
ncbi:hypothetical protein ABIB68_006614 [Bradyrhizobium sp. F1.2.2]